jgi:hypothetical protein
MSENDEVGIWLPIKPGRAPDDHLAAGERAVVDWLAELPSDRLRVVVGELLRLEGFRLEVRELLLDMGDEA